MTVIVYNPSAQTFPGGNLTGQISSPSGKWMSQRTYNLSEIPPREWKTLSLTFKPEESGVYTVKLDRLDLPLSSSMQQYWEVSGGFAAIQVEPPSTLFQVFTLIAIIAALLVIAPLLWRRTGVEGVQVRPSDLTPLLKAFNMFDAGKRMEKYLLEEKDDKKFESAVSWLLEILGFYAMKLDKIIRGESFREGETVVGSADILAYDSENDRVVVVDCTVGLPDAETLQGIANLAERLRSTVVKCDAIVVTSEKAEVRKRDAVNLGVIVVDRTDLELITGFVKSGRLDKARTRFE